MTSSSVSISHASNMECPTNYGGVTAFDATGCTVVPAAFPAAILNV